MSIIASTTIIPTFGVSKKVSKAFLTCFQNVFCARQKMNLRNVFKMVSEPILKNIKIMSARAIVMTVKPCSHQMWPKTLAARWLFFLMCGALLNPWVRRAGGTQRKIGGATVVRHSHGRCFARHPGHKRTKGHDSGWLSGKYV